ncbi:MAG: hypothetical protein HLUCCA12_07890 [Rhodobacteraceae bacterium HLUCCA12]|nr:MAG: hypothetical protein HLUCCA12_07890 [Rhodobacteraceae bacterium HLUCCA12]
MSDSSDNGKPIAFRARQGPRRMRGFEPAAGLLRAPIRKAGESRGFAVTKLLTHWPEIAGRDLADMCRPVKVSYGQGGLGATLTVLASGAAAPMVQMQLPALKERVNACYGYAAIARIHVTQTAPEGFGEAPATFSGPANVTAPSPQSLERARAVVGSLTEGMGDDGLKQALERLAQNVLTRHKGTDGSNR